jgi:hypothetical protein
MAVTALRVRLEQQGKPLTLLVGQRTCEHLDWAVIALVARRLAQLLAGLLHDRIGCAVDYEAGNARAGGRPSDLGVAQKNSRQWWN